MNLERLINLESIIKICFFPKILSTMWYFFFLAITHTFGGSWIHDLTLDLALTKGGGAPQCYYSHKKANRNWRILYPKTYPLKRSKTEISLGFSKCTWQWPKSPKKRKTKVAVKIIYHILLETPKETYTNLQYNCLKTTLQPMPPITNLL